MSSQCKTLGNKLFAKKTFIQVSFGLFCLFCILYFFLFNCEFCLFEVSELVCLPTKQAMFVCLFSCCTSFGIAQTKPNQMQFKCQSPLWLLIHSHTTLTSHMLSVQGGTFCIFFVRESRDEKEYSHKKH